MLKTVLVAAALLGLLLLTLRSLVVRLEPQLTFHPQKGLPLKPDGLGVPFQEIPLETADGERVIAWYLARSQAQAEILFLHGNAGNLSLWMELLVSMHRQGFNVYALDYRGYGESTGRPTEQGLYRDVEAALADFWPRRRCADEPVIYWGRSLGGPMAAFAAAQRPPHGLILEATFSSKDSLLRHYPVLRLLSRFSRYRFPTAQWLSRFPGPVLVIHGDADIVVPFQEGEALYRLLPQEKRLFRVHGGGHGDVHLADPPAYWQQIRQFAAELKGKTA